MKLGDGVQPFHAGDRVSNSYGGKGTVVGDIFFGFDLLNRTAQWFYVAMDHGGVVEVSAQEIKHVQ